MIINIQNLTASQKIREYDFAALAKIASECVFTERFDEKYFSVCPAEEAFLMEITCDRIARGVCVCRHTPIPDSVEVEVLCIDEKFRKSGLGRKLLCHALRNMRMHRYKTAFLWINERNIDAIDFFSRFGFEKDGKRRRDLRCDGDEIRFRIDI